MKVFAPRETEPGETRVSLTPDAVKRLVRLGAEVVVETGIGETIRVPDAAYEAAGAAVAALGEAELVVRLRPPAVDAVSGLRAGAILIAYLDPFHNRELLEALARQKVSALSMELIPRSTIAQKMDALSSQANLGGYVAVVMAAARLNKVLPMMMTPAGTIQPARVFVIGAGVAGLQAIATAKRLGARVEAFDTRPVVEEQVQSLGAKFVKVDLGETGQTQDGYAKQLTEEQLARQREAMAAHCAEADIVITTAQVFGRKAPRIITAEMVKGMKPGSVIVDMAAETGGNVEGSKVGEDVDVNGVTILGVSNLPGRVSTAATQMYASNLANFIEHFWDKDAKTFTLNTEDEIIKSSLVTHDGKIVNALVRQALGLDGATEERVP